MRIYPTLSSPRGLTLLELLVSLTIAGILMAVALPQFIKVRDAAFEAQTKSNLHTIHIALERYATDNGGFYPTYIYGGTTRSWWPKSGEIDPKQPFPSDPLVLFGYLKQYPKNPFKLDGPKLCELTKVDPRFGCWRAEGGEIMSGTTMGNALTDPNWAHTDTGKKGLSHYFFFGDGNPRTVDWIPGEFIYRSFGTATTSMASSPNGTRLVWVNYYFVLGAYGSTGTEGQDLLNGALVPEPGYLPFPDSKADYETQKSYHERTGSD
ncbi:MAG: type II secretion system protein, partial [bacterium]